jgi:hypothetical protein
MPGFPDLPQVLIDTRRRIERAKSTNLNEENTKITLIEPVLNALGWNTLDPEEVDREYRDQKGDNPADYALLVLREPKLLVEAKALGENLEDRRWANQIMSYATVAGAEWIVLTNGDEYRIYSPHAAVRVEDKLLISVRVSNPSNTAEQVLRLISKEQIATNRISALWQAHFVDRQVKVGLELLFNRGDDRLVVNHLRRHTKDLSPDDIRRSLRRLKVPEFDFPELPEEVLAADTGGAETPAMARAASGALSEASDVTLRQLIDAGILQAPVHLSCTYKEKSLTARVEADGTVVHAGQRHPSLSAAASAARASVIGPRPDGEAPATNGWIFWKCTDVNGRTRPIDEARQAFVAKTRSASGAADDSQKHAG